MFKERKAAMHNPFAENKKLFFLIVKIFEYILIITSENKDKVFHLRWQFPLPIHFKMSGKRDLSLLIHRLTGGLNL
ncbi:hypothetical protein HX13_05660 [Chryseobacterium sp. P1-3]|nr:hypothetical protein HX13_05660 [Chryseobacterium sp. P1-3]